MNSVAIMSLTKNKINNMDKISYSKIIDISLPLKESTITYPGNPEIKFNRNKGTTSLHTQIILGSHTGTHIDAPSHVFFNQGANVSDYSLSKMIGLARVLDVTEANESIKIIDLEKYNIQSGERILLKTKNSLNNYKKFRDDYIYLDGDAAQWLAEKEISLVGIDYLSIKKRGGKDNRPHTALLAKNIIIYEGICLTEVEEGEYFFIGFPLRFDELDGSPVRAILLE